MKKTANECVHCGLPCRGESCPNRSVTRYYCDKCGSEETLYLYDGMELCLDCVIEKLEVVEGSDL